MLSSVLSDRSKNGKKYKVGNGLNLQKLDNILLIGMLKEMSGDFQLCPKWIVWANTNMF